jgi:hypothetical protein
VPGWCWRWRGWLPSPGHHTSFGRSQEASVWCWVLGVHKQPLHVVLICWVCCADIRRGNLTRSAHPTQNSDRFAVVFDSALPGTPRVQVAASASSPHAAVFPTTPIATAGGFVVDVVLSSDTVTDVTVTWVASYQGPCDAHEHCPTSQYCDAYRGCEDCIVCRHLTDTFDEGPCPNRCLLDKGKSSPPVKAPAAAYGNAALAPPHRKR